MVPNPAIAMVLEAMERLGWNLTQLYVATTAYGSVGTMDDLQHHLVTGDGLGAGPAAVLLATLHEGLLDRSEPSPFYLDGVPATHG
jgi:hypothetical protein